MKMKKKRPLLQCISSLVLFLLLFVGLQTNPSQLLTMQSMTHLKTHSYSTIIVEKSNYQTTLKNHHQQVSNPFQSLKKLYRFFCHLLWNFPSQMYAIHPSNQILVNPSSFSGGLFSCISKSPPPMSISIAKPKIVSSTFDLAKKTTMNSEAPKPTWAVPKSTSSSHVLNTSTSFSFSTTTSPFQSSSLNSTTSLFQSHLNSTTTPAASPFSSSTWSTFTTLKSPQPPKEEKKKEEPLAEPKEAKKESLAEPKEANKEEPKEDKKDSSFSSQPIVSKKPNIIPIGQGIEAKPKEEGIPFLFYSFPSQNRHWTWRWWGSWLCTMISFCYSFSSITFIYSNCRTKSIAIMATEDWRSLAIQMYSSPLLVSIPSLLERIMDCVLSAEKALKVCLSTYDDSTRRTCNHVVIEQLLV